MAVPDTSSWDAVGQTTNARFYTIEPGVLGVVAGREVPDTAVTAIENVAFQKRYFAEHGRGVMLVFPDNATSQDRSARRVYQEQIKPEFMLGMAFVGGTALSRAFGAFFLGLSRPQVPFKMFADLDAGLAWARRLLAGQNSRESSQDH